MKVFTHYPALAPPIRDAGYEPVLLEPLDLPPGVTKIALHQEALIVVTPLSRPVMFHRATDLHGWEMLR